MGKFLLVFGLMVIFGSLAFAQGTPWPQGSWVLGAGIEGAVPVGDFNNVTSFGIGGMATGGYIIDPNAMLYARVGYLHFSGKDYTYETFDPITFQVITATANTSYSIVPILVGGRYYFMPPGDLRVYGAGEVGLYSLSASASSGSSSVSASSTKFGIAPTLGMQFKAGDKMDVDVHANYSIVFTDVSNSSWVGFGVGLLFDMAQ